jgi:broad specificity phosphatase PhoE
MLAVVFHLDPIMLVLAHFLGLPLDNFRRFSISPGSVSILAVDRSGGKLLGLNLIPPFTLPG